LQQFLPQLPGVPGVALRFSGVKKAPPLVPTALVFRPWRLACDYKKDSAVLIASAESGEEGGLRGKEVPRTQPEPASKRRRQWSGERAARPVALAALHGEDCELRDEGHWRLHLSLLWTHGTALQVMQFDSADLGALAAFTHALAVVPVPVPSPTTCWHHTHRLTDKWDFDQKQTKIPGKAAHPCHARSRWLGSGPQALCRRPPVPTAQAAGGERGASVGTPDAPPT
jgi:hypothetical protein